MVKDYNWGEFKPWAHQEEGFYRARNREFYAHLWEMRTGKTAVIIHQAAYLKSQGKIDGLLVMSPNYVKTVWEDDFLEHAPEWLEYDFRVWSPSKKMEEEIKEWGPNLGLNVLAMNEEAFSTKRGTEVAEAFLKKHNAMFVIDEATSISNHRAKRTKSVLKMRQLAPYRRILTGTPVTKGPLDLWAPFYFLDPGILGFSNFYGFRNRYAVMGGFKGKEVKGYIDIDMIKSRVERHSDRILRSDIRDMPPKIYQKLTVPMTPEQGRIYDEMRKEMLAEWENADREKRRLEVRAILTQILRLQQVTGGYIPSNSDDPDEIYRAPEPIPGSNPKLEALLGYIELNQEAEKVVIFARFRAEIAGIVSELTEKYGEDSVVEFHGGIKEDQKLTNRRRFQDPDDPARFFVANQRSARMGLDLSVARLVLWYSNSFDLLDRIQGEDRTETLKGELESTLHVDLLAAGTVDDKVVLPSLREKKKLSDLVTGDEPLSSWI